MRSPRVLWIVAIAMVLVDLYVFQVVELLSQHAAPATRLTIDVIFWGFSILFVLLWLVSPLIDFHALPKHFRNYLFITIAGIFFAKLLASVIFLIDDIRRSVMWLTGRPFTRSVVLSWIGIAIGGLLYTSLLYGFSNKYKYKLTPCAIEI